MAGLKGALRRALPAPLYRLYRGWRVPREVARYPNRVVEHDYGGHRYRVSIEDGMAEGWYDRDLPPLNEALFLRERGWLRAGSIVFDIGAHQGVIAMILAGDVAPGGKVVAIEAVPHNAAVAERNVALNEAAVTVLNAAIADEVGEAFVPWELNAHVSREGGAGLARVPAVTVDGLAGDFGAPDVVMLDVEGFELAALAGATGTLGERRTAWLVEVHVGAGLEEAGGSAEAVLACFDGYELFGAPAKGPAQAFQPLSKGHELLGEHLQLAAIPRPT